MKHLILIFFLVPTLTYAADTERLAKLEQRLQRLEDANQIEVVQRTYGYFVDKAMWREVSERAALQPHDTPADSARRPGRPACACSGTRLGDEHRGLGRCDV
jgi:hypothetical protein